MARRLLGVLASLETEAGLSGLAHHGQNAAGLVGGARALWADSEGSEEADDSLEWSSEGMSAELAAENRAAKALAREAGTPGGAGELLRPDLYSDDELLSVGYTYSQVGFGMRVFRS